MTILWNPDQTSRAITFVSRVRELALSAFFDVGKPFPLGGFREYIEPRKVVTLHNSSQRDFRVVRLVLPIAVAKLFDIRDLRVGNTSLFNAAGDIPGETFAGEFHLELPSRRWRAGTPIVIQVVNMTDEGQAFAAAVILETFEI